MKEGMLMMQRTRHTPALMLFLGLIVFLVAGCGGGGTASTTATSSDTGSTSPTTQPTVPVTTTQGGGLIDGLPSAYVADLGQRPIVILFYVVGSLDDEQVLTAVRELSNSYPTYRFLMYDYSQPDVYGNLAKVLGVDNYLPHIVLIDRQGNPFRVWRGYVDKGTLNQTLVDLGRE